MTMKLMQPALLTLVLVLVMGECQSQVAPSGILLGVLVPTPIILLRSEIPPPGFAVHDVLLDPAVKAKVERVRHNQHNSRQSSQQDQTSVMPSTKNVPVSNIPQRLGPASDQKPPQSGFTQSHPMNQGGSSQKIPENAQHGNQQVSPVQQGIPNQQGGNVQVGHNQQVGFTPKVPAQHAGSTHQAPTQPENVNQPLIPQSGTIKPVPAHQPNPIPPVPAQHGSFDQRVPTPANQHSNSSHPTGGQPINPNQHVSAGNGHSSPASSHNANPSSLPGQREPLCGKKPYPGECRAAFPRYFYNTATRQCDCFFYGGCGSEGLDSSYRTMAECVKRCLPENPQEGAQCKEVFRKHETFFAPPPAQTQGTKNPQQEPPKTPVDDLTQKELLELFEKDEELENNRDNDRPT